MIQFIIIIIRNELQSVENEHRWTPDCSYFTNRVTGSFSLPYNKQQPHATSITY